MISLHSRRFEWTHDPKVILTNITDFTGADTDFNPLCLMGKEWIFIKEDFETARSAIESPEGNDNGI
jgi:hypothetical protein